jgi:hypothetical protein
MDYIPPIGGAPGDPYVDGNAATGTQGSIVPAAAIEDPMREIVAVIQAAGLVPSAADLAQLLAALSSPGVFQTPAQFANDTSAATTAFVQRALGNFATDTIMNAAGAIPASAVGGVLALTAAGTYTLPAANSVPKGAALILAPSTAVIIQRSGTDVIGGASSLTSLSLGAGDTIVVSSDGGGVWRAIGGVGALVNSSAFSRSLTSSGYQRFPGGLIIQWGFTPLSSASAAVAVTFSIAFPTACSGITLGLWDAGSGAWSTLTNANSTGFQYSAWTSGGRVGGDSSFYIAVGY